MKIVIKSASGEDQVMDELVALAKSLIDAKTISNGGELTPQQADKLISLIKKNDFLAKINTVSMTRLTRNVDVVDFGPRQLKRVAQGQEPTAAQLAGASEHGTVLKALSAQLFPTLTLDFLRENKNNPDILNVIEQGFATRLANDIIDLGFNGIGDDYAGDDFLKLNEGWVHIAKTHADTHKVDIDPATSGWSDALGAVMDAGNEDFRSESTFLMNLADADAYARELGSHVTGTALTADSPLRRYEGYPIEAQPKMPRGHVMFTPLKNLAHGLHTQIERQREYKARKRALEYTFDMAFDFEIAAKDAVSIGKPAA